MQEQPPGLSSRDKILWAAASMLGENPGASLSVRAVAARAGVSTGSLQHHFPTQRELMDTVLGLVYELTLPTDSIDDTSIPARDRLVASLQRLLVPGVVEMNPRTDWIMTFERYIAIEPTDDVREEYLAIDRAVLRRIEYCLTVLQNEGAITPGDVTRRARLLLTVVTGISIGQALPADASRLPAELSVLNSAVDAIFGAPL